MKLTPAERAQLRELHRLGQKLSTLHTALVHLTHQHTQASADFVLALHTAPKHVQELYHTLNLIDQ